MRTDPERVRISARRRGQSAAFVDRVLALDAQRRAALTAAEALKAEKNALTGSISKAADRAAEAARRKPQIAALDARIAEAAAQLPAFDERDRRAAQRRAEPARCERSRRNRRGAQPRRAHVGHAARVRVRAQAALGTRRSARDLRLRARGEDLGQPLRDPARSGRAALARAGGVLPRSRRAQRLPRNRAAGAGLASDDVVDRPAFQIRRRDVQRSDRRSVLDSDRRGAADRDAPRRNPDRRRCRCSTPRTRRVFARKPARRAKTRAA